MLQRLHSVFSKQATRKRPDRLSVSSVSLLPTRGWSLACHWSLHPVEVQQAAAASWWACGPGGWCPSVKNELESLQSKRRSKGKNYISQWRQCEKETLPGPAMMAPPCWCRSPWKSNAGLVMALHVLFIWPMKAPDFTWGLGLARYTHTRTYTIPYEVLSWNKLTHRATLLLSYQRLWISPLSSSQAFDKCSSVGLHIFHKDNLLVSRTATYERERERCLTAVS